MPTVRGIVSVFLSSMLVLLSPGLGCLEALAQAKTRSVRAASPASSLPAGLSPIPSLIEPSFVNAGHPAPIAIPQAAVLAPDTRPVQAALPQRTEALASMLETVAPLIEAAGDISQAEPSEARTAGEKIEQAASGEIAADLTPSPETDGDLAQEWLTVLKTTGTYQGVDRAAEALLKLGPKAGPIVPQLSRIISLADLNEGIENHPYRAQTAMRLLGTMDLDPEQLKPVVAVVLTLFKKTEDAAFGSDVNLFRKSISFIEKLGSRAAFTVWELINLALEDKVSSNKRYYVIELIKKIGMAPENLNSIGYGLKAYRSVEIRQAAIELLEILGPGAIAAIPGLMAAVGNPLDGRDNLSFIAGRALRKIIPGPEQAAQVIPDLVKSLGKSSEQVAQAAVMLGALGSLAQAAWPDLVVASIEHYEPKIREIARAQAAVIKSSFPDVVDPARAFIPAGEPSLLEARLVQSLIEILEKGEDYGARERAAAALGAMGLKAQAALPALILNSINGGNRAAKEAADKIRAQQERALALEPLFERSRRIMESNPLSEAEAKLIHDLLGVLLVPGSLPPQRESAAAELGRLGRKAQAALPYLDFVGQEDPIAKVKSEALEAAEKINKAVTACLPVPYAQPRSWSRFFNWERRIFDWSAQAVGGLIRKFLPKPAVSFMGVASGGGFLVLPGKNGMVAFHDERGGFLRSVRVGDITPKALALSPDGRLLAGVGADERVRIWDAAGGKQMRIFDKPSGAVAALAISHDDKLVATVDALNHVTLWNAMTGRAIRSFLDARDDPEPATALAFSPDGRLLLGGGLYGSVVVWATEDGLLHNLNEGPFPVTALRASADSKWLFAGNGDGSVFKYELSSGGLISRLDREGAILALMPAQSDEKIAVISAGFEFHVWDSERDSIAPR